MPLELHIWGPAFGLQSIDPECLAAVAYLRLAAPQGAQGDPTSTSTSTSTSSSDSTTDSTTDTAWSVVVTSASATPHALPALRDTATARWVATGFDAIVAFAQAKAALSPAFVDIDAGLTPLQAADAAAFSAFLRAEAAPLVALSLYVSSANWVATTRPAYSAILPFPLTWIEPPAIREARAASAAHLGFSSLDTDRDADDDASSSLVAALNAFPERIRKAVADEAPKSTVQPKNTVQNKTLAAAVQASQRVSQALTPEAKAQIRLDAAARACLAVLAQQKADRPCLLRSTPTSLDCLAYAYLSLMRVPDVPRPFLRDALDRHHADLAVYATDMQHACFGAVPLSRSESKLTTRKDRPYLNPLWLRTLHGVVHSIPGLGGAWIVWLWRQVRVDDGVDIEEDVTTDAQAQALRPWRRSRRSVVGARRRQLLTVAGTAVGTALCVGLLVAYRRLPPFGSPVVVYERPRSGLWRMGAAGALLMAAL